jgi:hypothetical protein
VNPYYLRGDFDGDGKPDYAVAVREAKGGKLRVLVCATKAGSALLGGEGPGKPFSDMPDDIYFAPSWMVYSKAEVTEAIQYSSGPAPIGRIEGEAIAIVWEDGLALVYWNGKSYRWAAVEP